MTTKLQVKTTTGANPTAALPVADGGTGAGTAADARTNLGVTAAIAAGAPPLGTATGAVSEKIVTLVEDGAGPPCNVETSAGVFDASLGGIFRLSATKDGVIRFPTTGLVDQQPITFDIIQPAAGKSITFHANYVAAGVGGAVPAADTTPLKRCRYTGWYDSTSGKIALYYTPNSGF